MNGVQVAILIVRPRGGASRASFRSVVSRRIGGLSENSITLFTG